MKEKFFTWFPVVTGASESKLRRRERGIERVQTERVEFQLLKPKLRERQSFSFCFSFCFFLSGGEFSCRCHFKWNSSLLEMSSSSKFSSSSASIRGNRGSHAWQSGRGRGRFEVQLVSSRDEFQLELVSCRDEEAIPQICFSTVFFCKID